MTSLLQAIITKPKNTKYDGSDRDEKVIYIFRRSLITNVPWVVMFILMLYLPGFIKPFISETTQVTASFRFALGMFWYLITFGFFFQNYLNWFFNVNIVTNKKVVDVDFKGMLFGNISEASLDDVEDVTSKINGALRVIFNFGHVFVQTAGESREFEFRDVPDPARIRDLVADLSSDHNGHKEKDD